MEIKDNMPNLVNAFDEARLCAVHLDLQNNFYITAGHNIGMMRLFDSQETSMAYPVANNFATKLRKVSVPNLWVAFTDKWAKSTYAEFRAKLPVDAEGSIRPDWRFHHTITPRDDEAVFQKADMNAFQDPSSLLTSFMVKSGFDTILMTGVKYNACYQNSLLGALKQGFRVYAVLDATNCPDGCIFEASVQSQMNRQALTHKGRMTFTNTDQLVPVLAQAAVRKYRSEGMTASMG